MLDLVYLLMTLLWLGTDPPLWVVEMRGSNSSANVLQTLLVASTSIRMDIKYMFNHALVFIFITKSQFVAFFFYLNLVLV